MELGFTTMNTPEDVAPGDARPRARGARVHVPVDRRALAHPRRSHARPTRPAVTLPGPYRRMMDPFLSLMLAAARPPRTLRVGTGVALPLEHDLFALAKSVATLDRLSGGRFDFGVGVGWNVEQLADHRPDIAWPSSLPGAGGVHRRAARSCGATRRRSTTAAGSTSTPVWAEPEAAAGRPTRRSSGAWPVGSVPRTPSLGPTQWMPMDLALGDVAKRVDAVPRRRWPTPAVRRCPIILMAWGDPTLATARGYARARHRAGGARRRTATAGTIPTTRLPFLDRYAELVPELGG